MTWMQRLFAEPTAEIEAPRAPAQIIPPDQVGVDGGYDVAGLARRVATAYDHAPDVAAIGTVWIEQVGTTLFLRGSAHLFHARLKRGVFKPAPVAWCCGDMHLENFGSYHGDNGLAYFDINDFDEAALAPCANGS